MHNKKRTVNFQPILFQVDLDKFIVATYLFSTAPMAGLDDTLGDWNTRRF